MKLAKKTRLLLLERRPELMVKLLAYFEARPDIEVVEANADVRAFIAETAYMERRALMDAIKPDVIVVSLRAPIGRDLIWISRIQAMAFAPLIAFADFDMCGIRARGVRFFDVVARPESREPEAELNAFRKLAYAIRRAAMEDEHDNASLQPTLDAPGSSVELIAIGASTGGTEAILEIASALPEDMPPILIVQHITKGFAEVFAAHIHRKCALSAAVARHGDIALRGHVYVAPDAVHMTVRKRRNGYELLCGEETRASRHAPSIDTLFDSVADQAGDKAVGVLLTGMGKDGALGLARMRAAGALTIAQDERTSLIYGMPKAACDMGAVVLSLPLQKICAELVKQTHKGES